MSSEADIIAAAQRIAARLVGSCSMEHSMIEDEPALAALGSEEQARLLIEQHGEIFLCDGCGWWCENEEMHTDGHEQLCGDCTTEEKE